MENSTEKKSLFKKLVLSNLMDQSQAFYFYNGVLMLILYAIFDIFSNIYSAYLIGFTCPVFIICSFIFIFLKLATFKNIPIIQTEKKEERKENKENSDTNTNEENVSKNIEQRGQVLENQSIITFDKNRIAKIFIPVKFLSVLYIITNIGSASLTTVFSFYHTQDPIYVKPADINMAEYFVSNPNLSRKATTDSINSHLVKPLFSSPGVVESFKLDTLGNYEYNITYTNPKTSKSTTLNLNSLKCFIANYTECDVKAFCSCYQGNQCLEKKQFELFRFLILAKDTIKDTLYMVRIKNKAISIQ